MKWFSIGGIKEEIRKIHWPSTKEMSKSTLVVLTFVVLFAIYFFITEFVLVALLRLIGIGS